MNAAPGTSPPVDGALRSQRSLSQTYTNMAITQTGRMPSSLLCSLCLLVLGINASTLRVHPEQRYVRPQNRGFFTIEASEDFPDGDGGGAVAPALPLADRSASEGGSDSGTRPRYRSRRSTGDSATPKVYGQVRWCIPLTRFASAPASLHHLQPALAARDVLEKIAQAIRLFSKSHHFSHLVLKWLCVVSLSCGEERAQSGR